MQEPLHPTICALFKALRRMHPEARLVVEPMDADNPDGLPVRRPDIVAHSDGVTYAIDVGSKNTNWIL